MRFCGNRFGTIFADEIRRSRVQAMRNFRHRRWHLDEVFVKITMAIRDGFRPAIRLP
ncbi:MAG: hypothetical protein O9308_14395 [Beijerinckiaceae bacterium]|nr:hypothetical protein [Beijerinckiaceae bacterium]